MNEAFAAVILVVRWQGGTGESSSRAPTTPQGLHGVVRYRPLVDGVDGLALAGVTASAVDADPGPLLAAVEDLAPGARAQASLYRWRIGGVPYVDFLVRGGPVSVFGCDVRPEMADQWNQYYDERHFPGVVRQAIYVGGARFELVRPLRADLGETDPAHLVVYELVDVAALEQLDPDRMSPEARRELEDWKQHGLPHIGNPLRLRAVPA